jgi:hypothetical protein
MNKKIGLVLVVVGVLSTLLVLVIAADLDFWFSNPEGKFAKSWKNDIHLLEQSHKLPPEWKQIKEISVKAANYPAQDWIADIAAPISSQKTGRYRLDVFVIHWLDGYRYGVVLQYNLVDLKNQNTIWELGRTLKLGFVY